MTLVEISISPISSMALQPVFRLWPPHYFTQTVNSKDWSTYLTNTGE